MARSVDGAKWAQWRERMGRFQKGRRSAAEFCRREGVSEAAFYQWRRRLAEADAEALASEEPAGFMPVRVVGGASIDVRLPGGTQLLIPTGDPQALHLVIETLARADAQRAGGAAC